MKRYEEILAGYQKRKKDTLVDSLATGLTYVDDIAVDTGIMEEAGRICSVTSAVCGVLPFAVIAAMEGGKAILGRKPVKNATKDATNRMLKTGVAMGIGTLVAGAVGLWAALPAAVGARVLFDRYKSRALEGVRVQGRIDRLKNLRTQLDDRQEEEREEDFLPADPLEAAGVVT